MTQNQINKDTQVQYLKGVGPAKAKVFESLGILAVSDLLEYFPRDYVFAPKPTPIGKIIPGEDVTVVALVESVDFQPYRRRPVFEAVVEDETGFCNMIWFNAAYLQNKIEPGQLIVANGKAAEYKHQLQITNPKFITLNEDAENPEKLFSGAVYPATAQLSSRQIKKIITPVAEDAKKLIDEFFDKAFLKDKSLIKRSDAYKWIHTATEKERIKKATRRLKYDELFLMQLGLALRRYKTRHFAKAVNIQLSESLDSRIRKRFPFLLTEDQEKVIGEIVTDMTGDEPMNRLLQGDVGSGKTVVALYAALLAVANKQQVAIMAPTEILATQHFISIERYLRNSRLSHKLITASTPQKERKILNQQIKDGEIDLVVGTVALLNESIEFKSLGLAIIDEQHKFGVEQRSRLRKQATPHCLVMTATPIPRTLAMTAFGDLDVSIIKHCPPGRGKVVTRFVEPEDRGKAYEFIAQRLRAKRQAYFVYPRISSAEQNDDIKAATEEYEILSKKVFPQYNVALLHGQMPSEKKRQVMAEFRKGKIDCLVSTVVIEVGVDVPNATVMVIEAADRFGLAQLHQLRGRIGRGQDKSYCFLFAENHTDIAKQRLEVMVRTNDGFEIAEQDLRLRGPGEMFSTRQHGLPDLKIANIIDDYELMIMARRDAFDMVNSDPMLKNAEHQNIRKALLRRFGDTLGLADIA